jgi:hypothetical protein
MRVREIPSGVLANLTFVSSNQTEMCLLFSLNRWQTRLCKPTLSKTVCCLQWVPEQMDLLSVPLSVKAAAVGTLHVAQDKYLRRVLSLISTAEAIRFLELVTDKASFYYAVF